MQPAIVPLTDLKGKSDLAIEELIESHPGKVEILDDGVHLDMPERDVKAKVGAIFFGKAMDTICFFEGNCLGGTSARRYTNGRLLSPDMSVWTKYRPNSPYGRHHLYEIGPAPNLVLECEWEDAVHQTDKGIRKVQHCYFSETATGSPDTFGDPTIVEEAWVFAIPRECVVSAPQSALRAPWKYIPVLRDLLSSLLRCVFRFVYAPTPDDGPFATAWCGWWGALWMAAAIYVRCLWFLFVDTVAAEEYPPVDHRVPYLMVVHRGAPNAPTYFVMTPNKFFLPPWESHLRWMPPMATNQLLSACT